MNHVKRTQTIRFFEQQIELYQTQIQTLTADHRMDEANFVKIQLNIFSLFHSVFTAAIRICGDDDVQLRKFFQEKMQQISQNWSDSLKKAQSYDCTEKAHIEQLKLTAADQICEALYAIWEDRP